jgi:protein-S-isoprenylcysteine O-methyltransferase Ste14
VTSHPVGDAIFALWIAFWAYWLVAAINTKTPSSRWGRGAGIRLALVVIVVLLLRGHVLQGYARTTDDPWLEWTGLGVVVAGLGLAVWARLYLGRNWGTPMSSKVDPELVTAGPYRRIRHPIYSGLILASLGTMIGVSLYWVAAVVVLGAYFVYSGFAEERMMEAAFPEAYPPYKRSTKGFIPFVF